MPSVVTDKRFTGEPVAFIQTNSQALRRKNNDLYEIARSSRKPKSYMFFCTDSSLTVPQDRLWPIVRPKTAGLAIQFYARNAI